MYDAALPRGTIANCCDYICDFPATSNLTQACINHKKLHHRPPRYLTTSQISKLTQPDPRYNPNQQNNRTHNNSPKLNLQHILVIIRLRSQRNRNQHRQQNHIPADAVVLVQLLRILHTAVQRRHEVLSNPDDGLDEDEDVGDEPEDGVRGHEVRAAVADLVVLDYDEAGESGEEGDVV
jgi:hypothetical protein